VLELQLELVLELELLELERGRQELKRGRQQLVHVPDWVLQVQNGKSVLVAGHRRLV